MIRRMILLPAAQPALHRAVPLVALALAALVVAVVVARPVVAVMAVGTMEGMG